MNAKLDIVEKEVETFKTKNGDRQSVYLWGRDPERTGLRRSVKIALKTQADIDRADSLVGKMVDVAVKDIEVNEWSGDVIFSGVISNGK